MTGGVDILVPNGLLGGLLATPIDTEMRSEEENVLDSTQEAHDTSELRDKGEQTTPSNAQNDTEMDLECKHQYYRTPYFLLHLSAMVPNGLLLLDPSSNDESERAELQLLETT